jgi:hypothetical protein
VLPRSPSWSWLWALAGRGRGCDLMPMLAMTEPGQGMAENRGGRGARGGGPSFIVPRGRCVHRDADRGFRDCRRRARRTVAWSRTAGWTPIAHPERTVAVLSGCTLLVPVPVPMTAATAMMIVLSASRAIAGRPNRTTLPMPASREATAGSIRTVGPAVLAHPAKSVRSASAQAQPCVTVANIAMRGRPRFLARAGMPAGTAISATRLTTPVSMTRTASPGELATTIRSTSGGVARPACPFPDGR